MSLVVRYSALDDEHIRDGKVTCVTCKDRLPPEEMDAGHYLHEKSIRYDIDNVHCQCRPCNRREGKPFWSQNVRVQDNYRNYIAKRYGSERPHELLRRAQVLHKHSEDELKCLIARFAEVLVTMGIPF